MVENRKVELMSSVGVIVQARLTSKRFPNKILAKIGNRAAIEILNHRLSSLKEKNIKVIYAIPDTQENNELHQYLCNLKSPVYRGSESNVAQRYLEAANKFNIQQIIRITSDCPFTDSELIMQMLEKYLNSGVDYLSNTIDPSYPDGFDVEIFSRSSLEQTLIETTNEYDLEHVTTYIKNFDKFSKINVVSLKDMSMYRVTLDTLNDLDTLNFIYRNLSGINFTYSEIEQLLERFTPDDFSNREENKRFGYSALSPDRLWDRALNAIPGGTMLFSKRKENNLPIGWPTYFSDSKGCELRTLDGKVYFDFGLMGVGTSILGYSNAEINLEVQKGIEKGNLTTLLPPEEVFLAEKLINLHPWAHKAMFTRSGGEALAVAIRIARAYTGRQKIAICGYHGWHDWYLTGYKSNSSLMSQQFIDGLNPKGIAGDSLSYSVPFQFNNIDSLREVLRRHEIAAIVMEVERNEPPLPGYLQEVRQLSTESGIPLVFDECTSGFRKVVGGLHMHYGVVPDIATFGKTLGNGFAIAAVIGNNKVMSSTVNTFISSSFWSEKLGFVAALKTLEIMERDQSPSIVDKLGMMFQNNLRKFSLENNIDIEIKGIPAITTFNIKGFDPSIFQSFITLRMLNKNYLARNAIYLSVAHKDKLSQYCDSIFAIIQEANDLGESKLRTILGDNVVKNSIRKKNFEH